MGNIYASFIVLLMADSPTLPSDYCVSQHWDMGGNNTVLYQEPADCPSVLKTWSHTLNRIAGPFLTRARP